MNEGHGPGKIHAGQKSPPRIFRSGRLKKLISTWKVAARSIIFRKGGAYGKKP